MVKSEVTPEASLLSAAAIGALDLYAESDCESTVASPASVQFKSWALSRIVIAHSNFVLYYIS